MTSQPSRRSSRSSRPTLLVIDDDPDILLAYLDHALGDLFVHTEVARTGREGLEQMARLRPDVVLLDVYLPDSNGLELLRDLRAIEARCPVVVITASSTTDTAIEAVKRGAYDYLVKPPDLGQLQQVMTQALAVSRQMNVPAVIVAADEPAEAGDAILGRCPAMCDVYKAIGRVAGQDVIVLILGESGTGKELVARAVYQHSRRAAGPFLAVNCAAIPDALLESELFGHEAGAFTGAQRRRIGKFEQCSGGTLFLDEIGDLAPLTQAKLLRVLQEQQFERVGGNDVIRTDVRLIAATNRDLKSMVADGRFRADLYYRLNVSVIDLPPLRARGADVALLTRHYVARFGRELGKEIRQIDPQVLQSLQAHSWPGNVRELQNVLKQALLRTTGEALLPAAFPGQLMAAPASDPPPAEFAAADFDVARRVRELLAGGSTQIYDQIIAEVERVLLPLVLAHMGGSQAKAADLLGITRRTLRNKLRNLGLKVGVRIEPTTTGCRGTGGEALPAIAGQDGGCG